MYHQYKCFEIHLLFTGIKENCDIFDEDNVSSSKHVLNITPPELKKPKKKYKCPRSINTKKT